MQRAGLKSCLLVLACSACAGLPVTGGPPDHALIPIPEIRRPDGETAAWWYRAGAATAHNTGAGKEHATNIILFVGDGMSLPTVAAARILQGQRRGQPGEEEQLSFETFPYTALSKTYNTDRQTSDSASTVTALLAGSKTRNGLLGVGPGASAGDCASSRGAELASAIELADAAGLSTGIVTTTRLTHATPAGAYAHTPDRDWESDSDLPPTARQQGCVDVARQLLAFRAGDGIDVAMGGGRGKFQPSATPDPEYPQTHGLRSDGRDLVREWLERHPRGRYVWNTAQLDALDLSRTSHLLALFEPDHMKFEHERRGDQAGEPSLAEMTRAAIILLRKNQTGYFLLVEGGKIDHAHHMGNAYRALDETVSMAEAVRVARAMTSDRDTLIVVTSDHSHTMTFAGYPRRGNPILGKVIESHASDAPLARDAAGLPYTTLGYANGPGRPAREPGGRRDLSEVDTQAVDFLQEAAVPFKSETHGGDDVGVWASGPGASAVRGTIEQHVIFHLLTLSQPSIVSLLCRLGTCERGVPVRPPDLRALAPGEDAQPR